MKLFLAIGTLSLICLGAGCAQVDRALLKEHVKETVTVRTNGEVFYSTNYFTNYAANPVALEIAKGTELIPLYGGLISTGLTSLLGIYAAIRNKKKLKATVLGVEAGRKVILMMADGDRIDDAFKGAMIEEQEFQGERVGITRVVRHFTKKTTRKTVR